MSGIHVSEAYTYGFAKFRERSRNAHFTVVKPVVAKYWEC